MDNGSSPECRSKIGAKSRIPRLQRSASFSGRRVSLSPPPKSALGTVSLPDSPDEGFKTPTPSTAAIPASDWKTDDEELEALDSFSLSSVSSAVSCCVPSSSYAAAIQSSSERRIRPRNFKYQLHCHPSGSLNPSEYLTPTQRANQTIRRLKALLSRSETELQYKDFEIQRLTRELVELRLERGQSEGSTEGSTPVDNGVNGPSPSLADSGHFDDLNGGRHSSKESLAEKEADGVPATKGTWNTEKRRLVSFHMEQINDLKRQNTEEIQKIRARLTDRLEQALEQLGDSNSRYAALLSSYDKTREQLQEAEIQLRNLRELCARHEHQLSRFQSELDERETREYEIREKDIVEIDDLTKELSHLSQRVAELQQQVEHLTRENQQLREEAAQNVAASDGASDRDQRLAQLQSQVDRLTRENQQLHDQNQQKLTPHDEVREQLQKATAQLEKLKEKCNRECEQYGSSAREPETEPENGAGPPSQNRIAVGTDSRPGSRVGGQPDNGDGRGRDDRGPGSESGGPGKIPNGSGIGGVSGRPEGPNGPRKGASDHGNDAAITLQFLRSAVFYLLTDHDNLSGHLRAVQNILEFSAEERAAVDRVLRHGYLL